MPTLKESYVEELRKYLTKYPLMSNQPGQEPDGNPVLYSSIAIIIYVKHFGQDDFVKNWCMNLYENCVKSPGIISRGTHKFNDTQEHDDLIGLMAASLISGEESIAKEIYLKGKETFWVYDEGVYKSKSSIGRWFENWYARFPGFTDHAAICAKEEANLFWINLSFPFWGKLGGSSAQLDWVRVEAYKFGSQKSFVTDSIIKKWEANILKHRPGGMGDVFQEYYGKDHVFAKWMAGRV